MLLLAVAAVERGGCSN